MQFFTGISRNTQSKCAIIDRVCLGILKYCIAGYSLTCPIAWPTSSLSIQLPNFDCLSCLFYWCNSFETLHGYQWHIVQSTVSILLQSTRMKPEYPFKPLFRTTIKWHASRIPEVCVAGGAVNSTPAPKEQPSDMRVIVWQHTVNTYLPHNPRWNQYYSAQPPHQRIVYWDHYSAEQSVQDRITPRWAAETSLQCCC